MHKEISPIKNTSGVGYARALFKNWPKTTSDIFTVDSEFDLESVDYILGFTSHEECLSCMGFIYSQWQKTFKKEFRYLYE